MFHLSQCKVIFILKTVLKLDSLENMTLSVLLGPMEVLFTESDVFLMPFGCKGADAGRDEAKLFLK